MSFTKLLTIPTAFSSIKQCLLMPLSNIQERNVASHSPTAVTHPGMLLNDVTIPSMITVIIH